MTGLAFPALSPDFEPTRATLHAYAHAVGAIPRAHGIPHPRWWHVSLKVRPEGLVTDPVPLPAGGTLALRMDLRKHLIVARATDGSEHRIDVREGATGTEMGDRLLGIATGYGLTGGFDRDRFESDEPREYDPVAATAYLEAFTAAHTVFEQRRAGLGDPVGPAQVWPHGFDLAFEWFGARWEDEDGEAQRSQINLGFYPGGDPYFYSSPWPFEPVLIDTPLPHGATWNTEWNGAVLPYAEVAGRTDGADRVAGFARAVFEAASPGLED